MARSEDAVEVDQTARPQGEEVEIEVWKRSTGEKSQYQHRIEGPQLVVPGTPRLFYLGIHGSIV